MHMKESQEVEELSVPPEFNADRCEVGLLPEQVCLEYAPSLGCKRPNKKSQFFEITAGMLVLIRPCGIVVNMTEMLTSESLTQVFLFILRTFSRIVADIGRLRQSMWASAVPKKSGKKRQFRRHTTTSAR